MSARGGERTQSFLRNLPTNKMCCGHQAVNLPKTNHTEGKTKPENRRHNFPIFVGYGGGAAWITDVAVNRS